MLWARREDDDMKLELSTLSVLVPASFLVAAFPAFAQVKETRALEGFEAVRIGGGIDLVIGQGAGFVVEVESSDVDLDDVVTEVRRGTLEIRHERSLFDFFDWGGQVTVHVTLPKLVALTASGGSDVTSVGTFAGEALELGASGGSDVTLDVAVGALTVQVSGGSDVRLTGTARSASIQASGGSDFTASRLTADEASLQSSGGADIAIAVRERIVAHASGGSDISYSGDPRSVDVHSSGGGDVHRRR
jgi:hypothetical protein